MNRKEMIEMYSDFHKDAYGFRPRFDYENFTTEHLELDYKHFEKKIEQSNIMEESREKQAIQNFKDLLEEIIKYGAKNKKEALEWLVGAEFDINGDCNIQDIEHFAWEHGILFTEYGRNIVKMFCNSNYNNEY